MLPLHRHRTAFAAGGLVPAVLLLAVLALGGCDGIALEGKVFDWMGISPSALDDKERDPKMAERAPLVVPPSVTRLPEPGSGKTGSPALAALNDPELQKQAAAKERERLHLAYCRGEIQWKERTLNPEGTGGANRSPYGPCPGLLSLDGLTKK